MNGILVIDKPEGMTSHDVVQAIRKRFRTSKVGHLGTLDPMATGVLPLALGLATRLGRFLPNSPKVYEGEIRFGFSTTTYDREGEPTSDERPLEGNIEEAVRALTGSIDQSPPPFSAKKVGGTPAYKFARRNQPFELTPVRVEIYSFEILERNPPFMTFRVSCSPGTYVRSLAHDLGRRLGCGAHLTALRRTGSGDFQIQKAVKLDKASAADMIPMDSLSPSTPRLEVSESDEVKIVHGNPVPSGDAPGLEGAESARIFNKRGKFIAFASLEKGWVRPRVVLTSINSERTDMLGCILEKENES
jgi:tRNA pseudouridine55 synthase